MRTLINNLLALLAVTALAFYFARLFPVMQKGTDFADFYVGAQIVLQGRGHQLYDTAVQNEFLARYSGRVGTYFIHPPFETLVYLPFSLWTIARAYLLWCLLNMMLLIAVARALVRPVFRRWTWHVLLPLLLLFVPVLLDLLHGQDSLLLLLLFLSTFAALEGKEEFAAGCFLGCALFKFHLALAVAIPVFSAGRKKVLAGFGLVAAALLLISVKISGWEVLFSYPEFLAHFSQLPLAGVHKEQMANLRALFGLAFPDKSPVAMVMSGFSSLVVLWLNASSWVALAGRASQSAALPFANVVIGAILVSYHLSPHDLVILLLPMALIVHHLKTCGDIPAWSRAVFISTLVLLFLPPLHLISLRFHVYTYVCLPVLALFAVTYAEIKRLSVRD
jgi:hypothetical protein